MKAITTRFQGPTESSRGTRGSRIIATDGDFRVSVPYDHSLSSQAAHRKAAIQLCQTKWRHSAQAASDGCSRLVGGGTPKGFAFVVVPESCSCSGQLEGARSRRRR